MASDFTQSIAGKQMLDEENATLQITGRLKEANKKYQDILEQSNEWRKHVLSVVQAGLIALKQAEAGLVMKEQRLTDTHELVACFKQYVKLVHECPWANADWAPYISAFETGSNYVRLNYQNTEDCLPYILRIQEERQQIDSAIAELDVYAARIEELEKQLKTIYSRLVN